MKPGPSGSAPELCLEPDLEPELRVWPHVSGASLWFPFKQKSQREAAGSIPHKLPVEGFQGILSNLLKLADLQHRALACSPVML